MSDGAATNWLDVLKAAFWPALVLVALATFSGPLSELARSAATGAGPAQEIELGPIKIKLSERKAATIGPPDEEVASVLARLSDAEKEQLMSRSEDNWMQYCLDGGLLALDPKSRDRNAIESRFDALHLTQNVEHARDDRDFCRPDFVRWHKFTDLGIRVRRYLIDISIKAVTITRA